MLRPMRPACTPRACDRPSRDGRRHRAVARSSAFEPLQLLDQRLDPRWRRRAARPATRAAPCAASASSCDQRGRRPGPGASAPAPGACARSSSRSRSSRARSSRSCCTSAGRLLDALGEPVEVGAASSVVLGHRSLNRPPHAFAHGRHHAVLNGLDLGLRRACAPGAGTGARTPGSSCPAGVPGPA